MTLTKEWLQQTIAELEEERDAIPGAVNEDAAMALAAMKLALAALTAEPVAYIDPFSLQNFATYRAGETDNKRMGREWAWANSDAGLAPVYAAPPAPVVPEEATPGSIEILASIRPPHGVAYQWDEDQRHAAADAWNACCGAMMQGAEPSQHDELPEWLQQAHKLAELHGCSFVVFRHGEEAQCADPTKVIISFTDEGLGHHLAAPPKVVKS